MKFKVLLSLAFVVGGIGLVAGMKKVNDCCPCKKSTDMRTLRHAQYPVDDNFINRYSPRAMSGEIVMREELMPVFEAARWYPSSYNSQPARFVFAIRGTPAWDKMFDLLVPFNQQWVKNAGALILVISHNKFEHNGQPSVTHSFDTGAAWQNLALQASMNGLIAHGMSGFDYDKARKVFGLSSDYTVEAMIAIGKPGKVEDLPEEMRKGETPSGRKPIEEFVFEGSFDIKK